MRYRDPQQIAAAILLAAIGLSMLVAGVIMVLPAQSAQARPLLSELAIPDTPRELDRRHRADKATYRDLSPGIEECIDTTPHSQEPPRKLYVTVAEGDRRKMLQVISHSAKIHDSLVISTHHGREIAYHDGWEPSIRALDPFLMKNAGELTKDYARWAENAAAQPVPLEPPVRCPALPHKVLITVDEQSVGTISDKNTKEAGIMLIILTPLLLFVSFLIYTSPPPY